MYPEGSGFHPVSGYAKYKSLRFSKHRALAFLERIAEQKLGVCPLGKRGRRVRLLDESGMSREVHVPFYEGLAGRFRRSTHLTKPPLVRRGIYLPLTVCSAGAVQSLCRRVDGLAQGE